MKTIYNNRKDAGQALAERLAHFVDERDVLVLALPRGGVVVGYQIARTLRLPLEVFQVRKLGVPGEEELAMGAIASGGVRVVNSQVIESLRIYEKQIERAAQREAKVIEERQRMYHQNLPSHPIRDKTTILVDDGIATGATMKAAIAAVRPFNPKRLIVAVPVAPVSVVWEFRPEVDEFITLLAPARFFAIAEWYKDFSPVTDQDVCNLLKEAAEPAATT